MEVTIPKWIKRSGPEQVAAEPRSMLNVGKNRPLFEPVCFILRIKMCIFYGFGCLEGRFELKIRCRKQPWEMAGPSRARCGEKYGNMTARGCIWEHFEALWSCRGSP